MTTMLIDSEADQFVALVVCLPCYHRWISSFIAGTSLFTIECPSCGAQESFASVLPLEYLESIGEHQNHNTH